MLRLRAAIPALSTSYIARHLKGSLDWVSVDKDALLLWLPTDHRHIDDSSIQISAKPLPRTLSLDFSKFEYGNSWAQVAK